MRKYSKAYDAAHNLNARTNGGLIQMFTVDAANELTNVAVAGQWQVGFVYDGLGRRRIAQDYRWDAGTSGWVKTNEVRYVYDRMLPIQERDVNNNVQVTYWSTNSFKHGPLNSHAKTSF